MGLSRTELAKRLGVSHVTVRSWEINETKPNGPRLQTLSRCIGKPPEWLLYGDDGALNADITGDKFTTVALNETQTVLIELFDSLPDSDQMAFLESLKKQVDENERRYQELKAAQRKKSLKK
ncbi:transcriptional regulator with XRE-family HTH domain [Kosakonia sp. 1610]